MGNMDLNASGEHTCKQLMRVKFPPSPCRAQYVKGSCNSPTRPLKSEGGNGFQHRADDPDAIDGTHGDAIPLVVQQPPNQRNDHKAKGDNDIGKVGVVMPATTQATYSMQSGSPAKGRPAGVTCPLAWAPAIGEPPSERATSERPSVLMPELVERMARLRGVSDRFQIFHKTDKPTHEQQRLTSPILSAVQGIIHRLSGTHRKMMKAYMIMVPRQARVQSLRGAPQVIVDLIQDIEYDPASREASNIQRGDEPSLAREQVANVELGQMVCDSA
ncbi:MAG: hypothetical protein FRX49_13237 [Trebouxia sp. A1-2]|nr:MAG: hypothetical protein FRX49_13237 [Trebouxia sp. A1-2]